MAALDRGSAPDGSPPLLGVVPAGNPIGGASSAGDEGIEIDVLLEPAAWG